MHLLAPGTKQAWPNRAACWSPAIPATGRSRPRNASGSVRARAPYDGTTSGSADSGTPNSAPSRSSQRPARMSNSSVRDAFDASVMWRRPPVSRATRYESTVPTATSPLVTRAHTCGSLRASQSSFVPVK